MRVLGPSALDHKLDELVSVRTLNIPLGEAAKYRSRLRNSVLPGMNQQTVPVPVTIVFKVPESGQGVIGLEGLRRNPLRQIPGSSRPRRPEHGIATDDGPPGQVPQRSANTHGASEPCRGSDWRNHTVR